MAPSFFIIFSILCAIQIASGAISCSDVALSSINATTPLEYAMDTAKIYVCIDDQNNQDNWSLWGVSTNCYQCLKQPLLNHLNNSVQQLGPWNTINTDFAFDFQLWRNSVVAYEFTIKLEDRGVYLFRFTNANNQTTGVVETVAEPLPFYTPIWVALAIIAALAIIYAVGQWIYFTKILSPEEETPSVSLVLNFDRNGEENAALLRAASPRPSAQRLLALDTFRGMCIVVMIFVNYGGGGYWFFDHSKWNGLTFADLVFPWFIWIMGTAMPLSFRSIESKKLTRSQILYKIVRRSILLYALGLFLNNGYNTIDWRIPGVLQRFGISYLVVGLMILYLPRFFNDSKLGHEEPARTISQQVTEFSKEIASFGLHWLFVLLLLLIWLLVTFVMPVPGCPTGYIGPGGIGDFGRAENCTGGAAGYVDHVIYGSRHIYGHPTCKELYKTGGYDPEGTMGYITSIVLCFLGVQSGAILVKHKDHKSRVWRWIFWGIFWGLWGLALCEGKKNGGLIPINKNLWSVSFIFVMAGTGYLTLAFFYVVIDIFKLWNGSPLKFVGMNPILIYCSHEILGGYFPFGFETPENHAYRLFCNIVGVSCWLIVAYRMFQLKFFVNI